jgi:2-hydroxychromene-2-carboxylate isomerase
VTIWFDPSCPFTWRTSRWVRAEAQTRDAGVTWRLLSLAVLNEGREIPEQYRQGQQRSQAASRVLAAAADRGNDVIDAVYTELGRRVHEDGRALDRDTVAEAITAAGAPADLIAAYDDETWDKNVRTMHEESQLRAGQESGSPVLAFGSHRAFFGPILTAVPTGTDATRLWDAVAALSGIDIFSELKRSR